MVQSKVFRVKKQAKNAIFLEHVQYILLSGIYLHRF